MVGTVAGIIKRAVSGFRERIEQIVSWRNLLSSHWLERIIGMHPFNPFPESADSTRCTNLLSEARIYRKTRIDQGRIKIRVFL